MKKALLILFAAAITASTLTGCVPRMHDGNDNDQNEFYGDRDSGYGEDDERGEDEDPDGAENPVRGRIDENVYTNEFANLTFTKPDTWTYATDEQIAEKMDLNADLMVEAGLPLNEEMLKLQAIYDMFAQDPETGTNVLVMFENLSAIAGGADMSEQDYSEALKAQLTQVPDMNYTFVDAAARTISEQSYTGFAAAANLDDVPIHQVYCVRKQGGHMISIIFSLKEDADINEILTYFS